MGLTVSSLSPHNNKMKRTVLRAKERMPQLDQRHRGATVHWSTHPQREPDEAKKYSFGVDWLQKGIYYCSAKLGNELSQNVQDIKRSQTLSRKPWKPGEWNWQREEKDEQKQRSREVYSREIHYHLSTYNRDEATQPHTQEMHKWIQSYKITTKINHQMCIDDIKLSAKDEEEF